MLPAQAASGWPGLAVTIRSQAQDGHGIRLGGEAVYAP